MNRTKIEWCDFTWNPVTGCGHNCSYCYARNQARRFGDDFKPKFHIERLNQPFKRKKPSKIFVVSMGDLFGDWVPDEWIKQVFQACEAAPWHTYFFLTKNPYQYSESGIQEKLQDNKNWWAGFSASCEYTYYMRYRHIKQWPRVFLSLEPFLDGDLSLTMPLDYIGPSLDPVGWLIVGAQTKPLKLPERKWILDIRKQCAALNIPLFEKNNLAKLDLPGGLIQQWPEGLK